MLAADPACVFVAVFVAGAAGRVYSSACESLLAGTGVFVGVFVAGTGVFVGVCCCRRRRHRRVRRRVGAGTGVFVGVFVAGGAMGVFVAVSAGGGVIVGSLDAVGVAVGSGAGQWGRWA